MRVRDGFTSLPETRGERDRCARMDHTATARSQKITLDRSGEHVPDGIVKAELNASRGGRRWYLVSIGRSRYVKRFNLTDAEARQLIDVLTDLISQ